MKPKWEYKKIGDICLVERGGSPRPIGQYITDSDDGINWIKIGDTTESMYITKTAQKIKPEGMKKSRYVQSGDFLLSNSMSFGRPYILQIDGCIHDGWLVLRDENDLFDKRFLYYYLSAKPTYERFKTMAVGGVVNNLNSEMVRNLFVPVPSKVEQSKIADLLDISRNVILKRKQQLQKLDELVKARFVELFGTETEFDKWPCCTIGDVADVCVGVVIKPTQYYTDKGIPAFRSLNIGEMRVKDSDWVYFTEEGHQKNQKSVVHKNDVLVVRSGAPGTACIATEKYDGYNAVDIIIAHPDNSKVNSIFLAAFTNMPHGMNQIRERTGGAAQQHFNVGGYKAMRLIMPSIELQNQYAAFVEQTDKSKLAIQQSLDKLKTLRKSLMQEYYGQGE